MGYLDGYGGGYAPAGGVAAPTRVSGRPRWRLELAMEDPLVEPVWHNESAYLRGANPGITMDRGRSTELEEFTPGVATVLLDDRYGRYDNDNPDSPYAGNLVPRRHARLSALVGQRPSAFTVLRSAVGGRDCIGGRERAIPLIQGFTGPFARSWRTNDSTVSLTITDASVLLATDVPEVQDDITGAFGPLTVSGSTGDAVVQLLARFGWPGVEGAVAPIHNAYADIDVGTVGLLGDVQVPGQYLAALQKLALTEGGAWFISREGKATFRAAGDPGKDVGIWGDDRDAGELPYRNPILAPADAHLANRVTVATDTGASVTRSSAEAASRYGEQSLPTVQVYPSPNIDVRAAELLSRYVEPHERVAGFEPLGRNSVAYWRRILDREYGDAFQFKLHTPAGDLVERRLRLEGIALNAPEEGDTSMRWQASEVLAQNPNLLAPNQADFEADPIDWIALSNCTVDRVDVFATYGVGAVIGAYAMRIVVDDTDVDAVATLAATVSADPSQTFRAGVSLRLVPPSLFGVSGIRATVELEWYDEFDVLVSAASTFDSVRAYQWTALDLTPVAPSTAAQVLMRITVTAVGPNIPDPGTLVVIADAAFIRQL